MMAALGAPDVTAAALEVLQNEVELNADKEIIGLYGVSVTITSQPQPNPNPKPQPSR